MKKLYFLMITVLISVSSFAQPGSAHSLRVINETNCYQYFDVLGGIPCQCATQDHASGIIGIAPGATLYYPDSTTIGGTFPPSSPRGIMLARVLNQPPPYNCPPGGGTVGQPACGTPASVSYTTYESNCRVCASTTATWYPASSSCSQEARL